MAPRKTAVKAGKKKALSTAHKKALARGRTEARVVREYLDLLRASKPKRGRKRTIETVRRQLAETIKRLSDGSISSIEALRLNQRKLDLTAELKAMSAPKVDLTKLEAAFVKVAASYGARQGICSDAWKAMGVPPSVIKRAGL